MPSTDPDQHRADGAPPLLDRATDAIMHMRAHPDAFSADVKRMFRRDAAAVLSAIQPGDDLGGGLVAAKRSAIEGDEGGGR